MKEIKNHQRVNDILLGPLERPALNWLAAHMPAWVTPDILTLVGVAGALIIAGSYALTKYSPYFLWLASLGFIINWFGDSLDGTVARYRNIQRPMYGFYVDHTVDAITESIIFIGIGLSPYVQMSIALLALIGYLLISIQVYIRTCTEGVFQISYGKLGPTEARAIVILFNALIFFVGNPAVQTPFGPLTLFELFAIFLAFLFFAIFMGATIRGFSDLRHAD